MENKDGAGAANSGERVNEYLKFWNPGKENLRQMIAHPDVWNHEIPFYMESLFKGVAEPVRDKPVALEIGCGIGRLMDPVGCCFNEVIGYDISQQMIDESKEYLKVANPLCRTYLIKEPWLFAEVPDNSVDFVYSVITIQHIPDIEIFRTYLRETMRVLVPDGQVRMQTYCGNPSHGFDGYHGLFYPTLSSFKDEFTFSGFTATDAEHGLGHPAWLWVTAKK